MARKTVMRPGQLNEDTLQDSDKDTKIQVEESADEDKIRFDTAGTERMIILSNGSVGIGTTSPQRTLHVETSDDTVVKFHSTTDKAVLRLSDNDSESFIITKDNKCHIGNTSADLDVFTIDWATNVVGIGTDNPRTALHVVHDYHASTFENQLADGEGGGRVIKYSPGADDTLVAGQLYFLHTDGTWDSADADAVATGGSQLLGVGLGSARLVGVLLEGFVRVPSTEILNVPGAGAVDGLPVYVSTTAGHFDFTAPSDPGDFVRVVGYAIDDDSSDVLVYFNPSTTWIEM